MSGERGFSPEEELAARRPGHTENGPMTTQFSSSDNRPFLVPPENKGPEGDLGKRPPKLSTENHPHQILETSTDK